MRFVATADLQIGMVASNLGAKAPAFQHARITVIETLGRLATEHGASAVVIAGDLFDRDPVGDGDLGTTLDALRALALPVLVLPGNHDSDHPGSVWRSEAFRRGRPPLVTLLGEQPVELEGWTFHGAPLPTRKPDEPLVERLLATLPADGAPRVVVGHGAVDVVAGDHGDPSMLRLAELARALDEGRARFVVLGDRHSPKRVDEAGRIWYPGAPEPTWFGDGPGSALIVDLGAPADGAVPTVTTVTTGTWRYERLTPHFASDDDVPALIGALAGLERGHSTVVQVRPTGALGLAARAGLERELAEQAARFAVLDARLEDVAMVPTLDELDALPLPGYARAVVTELTARIAAADAAGEPDTEAIDELALLLRTSAGLR